MFPGERAKYRKPEKPPPAPPPEGGLFGGGGGEAGFTPKKGFRRAPEPEGEAAGEAVKRSDIVKLLREKFDIPIRTGKIRSAPGTLGIFKVKPEVIRSKLANDIETIAHEIGHALQKFIWPEARNRKGLTGAPFKAYEDELLPLATRARAGVNPTTEGFAEFVRRYVTNEQQARQVAPRTYAWFESVLSEKAPEAREILLQARQEYDRWLKQPAAARILGQLSIGEKEKRPFTWDSLYTKVIDKLHPIQMIEEAMAGKDVAAVDSVYKRMRLFAGWRGKATAFLESGTFDYNTLAKTGKSLEDIIRPFREDFDNLRIFIVAKRALEKSSQGIETGILRSDAEIVLRDFGTKYDEVWSDLQKYQNAVLRYGVDAGLISPSDYIAMKKENLDYAPFYRVMEDRPTGGTGKGWEAKSPLKGMKGSARDIIDPLESIIKNTYTIINAAEKNAVGQTLVKMATDSEGMGKYVEKIPADRKPTAIFEKELLDILRKYGKWTETEQFTQTGQKIRESIREEGTGGENIPPGDRGQRLMEDRAMEALTSRGWTKNEAQIIIRKIKSAKDEGARNTIIEKVIEKTVVKTTVREFGVELPEGLAYIFRNAPWKPKGNVIAVTEKGKVNYYEVHPDVFRTFEALDQEMANALVRMLAKPARLLRAGATLTPEFMSRNPLRDQWSAFLYSKYGYTPIVDAVRGAAHLFKKDEIYRLWQIGGGEHATLVSMDRDYLQKNLADIVREKTAGKELANIVRHPIDFLRMMSEFGEQATRVGEFAKGLKAEKAAGKVEKAAAMEAAFASREVTLDFARVGSQTQSVNMIVAFWNANVQGMDKMVRELKANPASVTARALAAITLPSILLNLANRQDPRWNDIPQWQKDLFWIVMTKDTIWRIPKPFEVGILFGSVPERFLDYALSKDTHAFDGIFKTVSRGAAPGFIPTAMNPFIENWANKSSFTDRPIVPRVREQLPPRYQYQPHTTELAKMIGKYVSKLPYLGDSSAASPAKIENLVRGWTGGLGMHVMRISDTALQKAGVNPRRIDPTPTLSDNPFVRGFVVRYPSSGGEQVQKFYDNYEKATKALATTRILLKKELDVKGAQEVISATSVVKIEWIHKALTNSQRTIELIYANPEILPDEKRKLIDTVYLQMRDMASEGNKMILSIEKSRIPNQ